MFSFQTTPTTEIYTLSLHDALPIYTDVWLFCWIPDRMVPWRRRASSGMPPRTARTSANTADRKSTRLNSSHPSTSYAVFCLKEINEIRFLTDHAVTGAVIVYLAYYV